jgi:hypothetical protein
VTPPSAPEDRHDQAKGDTDNEAGDDRKIKRGVAAFDSNVTGQTSQPFRGEADPENKTDQSDDQADDNEDSAEVVHEERRLR